MAAWCVCCCHSVKLGDLHEAIHRDNRAAIAYFSTDDRFDIPPKVDLHSQLESWLASGCSCVSHHVALIPPRPKYLPPKPWNPQADGTGEGIE